MKKKLLIIILLAGALVLPTIALAQAAPAAPAAPAAGGGTTLPGIANAIKTAVQGTLVAIAVVGWAIAALLYLTSAGSPERMGVAKKAVIAATIGTVLAVLSLGAGQVIDLIKKTFGLG